MQLPSASLLLLLLLQLQSAVMETPGHAEAFQRGTLTC